MECRVFGGRIMKSRIKSLPIWLGIWRMLRASCRWLVSGLFVVTEDIALFCRRWRSDVSDERPSVLARALSAITWRWMTSSLCCCTSSKSLLLSSAQQSVRSMVGVSLRITWCCRSDWLACKSNTKQQTRAAALANTEGSGLEDVANYTK